VRYRSPDGTKGELRADLTVACDGRTSVLRTDAGLRPHEYHVPIDTWWFRLPKNPTERGNGLTVRMRGGEIGLTLDREDYFQVAYLAKKGVDATIRAEGVQHFRERIANLMPQLADRVDAIAAMDDVKVLDVKLNRLRKWYKKGLLCIGDAAHAMSPIGGVGINVAVQDAVATARILAGPLLAGRVTESDLARVQVTRWLPTVVIQGLQRLMHGGLIGPVVRAERTSYPRLPLMLTSRFPALRVVPAYIVGIGPRPEHAPEFARRAPTSTS
jgi:2-polyprenyl-6-methoxyphenol hydroxylase-like FAD-dependent oxidoreductase